MRPRPGRPLLVALALAGCYQGPPEGAESETATTASAASVTGESSGSSAAASSTADASTSGGDTTGTSGRETSSGTTGGLGSTGTTSTTTTTTTTGDPTTTTTTGGQGAYCDADNGWEAGWGSLEEQVLEIVNQRRAQGANCGSEGDFGPAGPLMMDDLLRCAARLHSRDMVERDFFSHTNPDGESPWDRIAKTGYGGYSSAGENIAAGSGTAAGVMDQWMTSDGHCANIMNPAFNYIGVGYYPGGGYGHYWTQVFTQK